MSKKKTVYRKLIWKKAMLVLPRFLLSLVLSVLAVGLCAFVVYKASGEERMLPGIDVAVVAEGDDLMVQMGMNLVQGMESVKSLCRFHSTDEADAVSGLQSEKYQAAVYLPEDIYDDVNEGVNTPVRVQISSRSILSLSLFRDLVDTALSMIQTGESAVYALYDTSYAYETNGKVDPLTDRIAAGFMTLAITRGSDFRVTVLSPYGDISIRSFYTVTIVLFLVCLLLGACFAGLFRREKEAMLVSLKRNGITDLTRTGAKISAMMLVLFPLLTVTYIALSRLTDISVFRLASLLFLLVLSLSLASFMHLICQVVPGEACSLFYMIVSMVIFLLGGGLFPSSMLPESLHVLPALLPVRGWQRCLLEVFEGTLSSEVLLEVLLYGFIMAAAAYLISMAGSEKTGKEHMNR